jgi:hypothetical protein
MSDQTVGIKLSRFAFIFLVYAVVTSGYITETLSCQFRSFMAESMIGRHVFGIIMIFTFIMMEGGWSFDIEENNAAPNDWSSGNCFHTLIIAIGIYSVFLISSKSQLIPNMLFIVSAFITYLIGTQRSYWYSRKMISEDTNQIMIKLQYVFAFITVGILIYGFYDYYQYQIVNYGKNFSFLKFLFGGHTCASFID